MEKFLLPVSWEVFGNLEIEAEDFEDFLQKVNELREHSDNIALPRNPTYIEGSFVVEEDDEIVALENGL